MRLLELYAEEFGLFSDRRFVLGEGLTLIEGANESGKSTLQALLRFLFYGFPRRGGEEGEERYKRISRKTHRAAGSVRFLFQGKEYLLYRDYVLHTVGGRETPAERVTVTATADGSTAQLGGRSPGEYFLGLPIELYHSSVCVRQSEVEGVTAATGDLIGELLFFGEGQASPDTAEKILDDARRALQHNRGKGGRIDELEEERLALQNALDGAREAAERLRVLRNEKSRFAIQAQDKSRELKKAEAMLQAARLDIQLARYDRWHAASEAERAAFDAWQAGKATVAAPPPPQEFFAAARETLRRLTVAGGNTALRAEELELAKNEMQRHKQTATDAYIAAEGGDTKILQRAAKYATKKKAFTAFLAVFALLAVALGVGGIFLPVLLIPAAACLPVAAFSLLGRQRSARGARAFYRKLGISSPAMLHTLLARHVSEEKARRDAVAIFENAEALWRDAAAREAEIFTELQALFASIGAAAYCQTPRAAEEYLEALAARATATEQAFLEERMCYENAKSARTVLENELELAEEPALRAARAALPDPDGGEAELLRKIAFVRETANGIAEKLTATEREEIALMASAPDAATLQASLYEVETELAEARRRLAAIKMASEGLCEASEALRAGVMPALAENASRIFEMLTGGAYRTLRITDQLGVSIQTPQGDLPLSHFSAGCRDAAYFALRMGLSSLITKEPLPLLLDEITTRLDDMRTARLLSLLTSICRAGGQCLLFTCHTREAHLLGDADFVHIKL